MSIWNKPNKYVQSINTYKDGADDLHTFFALQGG